MERWGKLKHGVFCFTMKKMKRIKADMKRANLHVLHDLHGFNPSPHAHVRVFTSYDP